MNRWIFSALLIPCFFAVFPATVSACLDNCYTPTTSSATCSAGTYSCACTSTTNTNVARSTAASSTADAAGCDAFCATMSTDTYSLTCTYTNGSVNQPVSQGNVGSTTADETKIDEPIVTEATFVVPNLNVAIPGFDGFTPPTKVGDTVSVNFLAEYINAVYGWALSAAALVAVVMMMLGGLQYVLSRGKSKYIEKAKTRITNAITGLVLLLAAYEIAYVIDPNTVRLKSLAVRTVDMVEWVQDSGDTPGAGATPDATSVASVSSSIICDKTSALFDIASSTIGHVTYRLGGKYGGKPPYVDGVSKVDPQGVQYKTYCPEGQLCLDCSGYNDFLRKCGGLGDGGESGGTAGIFSGPKAIKITTYNDTSINGAPLIPGDLIGFPTITVDGKEKIGHVVMYVGNGKIAQSHGGSGRKPGNAIMISATSGFIAQMVKDNRTPYVRHR